MSLLNDALKAAEQRQGKPAPTAYVGGGTATRSTRRGPAVLLFVLCLLLILATVAWFWPWPMVSDGNEPAAVVGEPAPVPAQREVAEPQPEAPQPLAADSEPARPSAQDNPVVASGNATNPAATMAEPDVVSAPDTIAPPQQEKTIATAPAEPRSPESRQPEAEEKPAEAPAAEASPAQPVAASDIKQGRQSPEQRDRQLAKRIKAQLARGDTIAAEQTLREITASQAAPASRYTFARSILARGEVDQALNWVPADLAARHPELRLVRARAQLAGGDLDQAVTTLQQQVPPVADQVEYRVTLATLLQQQGHSDQAANHWAELIAWDSGRAPWWVGLAIALEGRGDTTGAARAYQQAAALPGLAPSLADYVRQRLQSLGAG
ncbi:hypothetical protein MLC59_08885 [Marinobacter bryozoorum]|uniref:tetratricopeptide repeat protein n=1 Tax=Marinobacter bryozoorum TaxID=256324 RepID=UPI002003890E|nr:hypothetical protein [Marinobacter bryozoorum]MCK7544282.1 hypothetical protein [Marinobacter bryozoorum]